MKRCVVAIVVLLFGMSLSGCTCAEVSSGERGILWKMIGGTQKEVYNEGLHFMAPWNKMVVYDCRTQEAKEILHILSNNGLSIDMEASVRFHPDCAQLFDLHTGIGSGYYEVVVGPIIRSEARKVGGRFAPEEIYSTKREIVEKEIFEEIDKALNASKGKNIMVEAILIRDVKLPDQIKQGIEEKLAEEQRALKMKFTLLKEEQEAERKRIEAKGISDFQKVVSTGLTEMLLQWKGIEATEKIASSPNAKVVIVGNPKTGLPVILGQ